MHENETCQLPIGYIFVPPQQLDEVFTPEEGLSKGTMFPELNMPLGVYGGGAENG